VVLRDKKTNIITRTTTVNVSLQCNGKLWNKPDKNFSGTSSPDVEVGFFPFPTPCFLPPLVFILKFKNLHWNKNFQFPSTSARGEKRRLSSKRVGSGIRPIKPEPDFNA